MPQKFNYFTQCISFRDERRNHPGGRLMVVLTELKDRRTRSLKVLVLDAGREGWKETHDIDTVLFVGVNGSLCVPTREHPELKAGCVYYYNQGNPGACNGNYNYNGVWVFSLKDGIGEKFVVLGQYRSWPPPAWSDGCSNRKLMSYEL
uniref:KIB1-4 beta-propeller domain-containing protein n=1 Tax=Aegilops tauschii TaxID=37682 RepID=M8CT48_AEGTA